jgi:hypothetical protein
MDVASIRNRVIDQLLAINDPDYLVALSRMIDSSHKESPTVSLSEEQKLMLSMSEEDIAADRMVDQQALHESELRWLKGR